MQAFEQYSAHNDHCAQHPPQHKGAEIQLLDLPGIIEGASQGKGRGKQVIAVARTADLVLMMLDAAKGEIQKYDSLYECAELCRYEMYMHSKTEIKCCENSL